MNKILLLLLLGLFFTLGCVTDTELLPGTGLISIGDREVNYATMGEGSPVVVFETGLGQSMTTWLPIFEKVGETTKVFAYNRPSYEISSEVPSIHSTQEIAELLQQNLYETGNMPPYIFVGHSFGGILANAFARIYPEDVVGLVFVDSSHPRQLIALEAMGIEHPISELDYENEILYNMYSEFETFDAFPDIPLFVLTAQQSVEDSELWFELQQELAALSSNSIHEIVNETGHFIHSDNPEKVIDAIKEIFDTVTQEE
jgi:pimeloyl-ACP methyl ester carboxylesterase